MADEENEARDEIQDGTPEGAPEVTPAADAQVPGAAGDMTSDAAGDAPGDAAGEFDAGGVAPGANIAVSPEIESLLGVAATRALADLATRALDVLTVGIDSVAGQRAALVDATISVTDYAAVEAEFATIDHMGFEVRVALSPDESHLAAILVPLSELGALLSLDLGAEALEDEEAAQAQTDTVGASMRQILDLVSLTLFTDTLQGVEATLSDLRIGQIEYTMGIVGDVAQGAPAVRVHLALARTDGSVMAIQLIVPSTLVMALVGRIDPSLAVEPIAAMEDEAEATEPTPMRRATPAAAAGGAADEPRGFGLSDDPENVVPLRPAGTFGASVGDDVDVHPVRFPPLPGTRPPPPLPRRARST